MTSGVWGCKAVGTLGILAFLTSPPGGHGNGGNGGKPGKGPKKCFFNGLSEGMCEYMCPDGKGGWTRMVTNKRPPCPPTDTM
jgi:hypothetical protein